jgi:hypothetical protein
LVTMDQAKIEKEVPTSQPFPTRLFTMLQESHRRGFEDVIAWQPGGESFRVFKADRFAAEIAGGFFALRKYKSFLRQVSLVCDNLDQISNVLFLFAHDLLPAEYLRISANPSRS